jgi:hypothetical protein
MPGFDLMQDLINDGPPIVKIDAGSDEADFFDHVDQELLFTIRLERRRHIRPIAR